LRAFDLWEGDTIEFNPVLIIESLIDTYHSDSPLGYEMKKRIVLGAIAIFRTCLFYPFTRLEDSFTQKILLFPTVLLLIFILFGGAISGKMKYSLLRFVILTILYQAFLFFIMHKDILQNNMKCI